MKTINKLVGILLISMSVSVTYAQQISEYGTYLKSATSAESQRIVDLSSSIQPAIYLERGAEKVIGTAAPTFIMCDISSISNLSKVLNKYSTIELIELRIKESSELSSLNLTNELVNTSSTLKAIIIRAEYPVSESEFRNMFKSIRNKKITLLYEVSIPH